MHTHIYLACSHIHTISPIAAQSSIFTAQIRIGIILLISNASNLAYKSVRTCPKNANAFALPRRTNGFSVGPSRKRACLVSPFPLRFPFPLPFTISLGRTTGMWGIVSRALGSLESTVRFWSSRGRSEGELELRPEGIW
jgi:hypothetical protein